MKQIYDTDGGEFTEAGVVDWTGEQFSISTENDDVERIVERVNQTRTWDTAEPPEESNAPVAERDEPMDKERATQHLRTLLMINGFGVDPDDE
jgi:hypothetical protein